MAVITQDLGKVSPAGEIEDINKKIPSEASSTNQLADKAFISDTYQTKLSAGSNISIANGKVSCDVSTMNFRGAVAEKTDLPTTDLDVGDVYNITSTSDSYCWNGTEWVGIGTSVDLTGYVRHVSLTEEEYTELEALGEIDDNTVYEITDSGSTSISLIPVDDTKITTTNTWSANKINNVLGDYVKTSSITDSVKDGDMSPITSNAVNDSVSSKSYVQLNSTKVSGVNFVVDSSNSTLTITTIS